LSLFTHLWNPIGFPAFWVVEAQYMQRAMHVLEGYGLHEPRGFYEHFYDHPFFGQIFLAGMLKATDYPNSIGLKSGDIHSIEMLYLVPRLIVGALAIVDTLLVYKIAERRYNRTVALFAAVLFAVMPVTWILRKILLESLLLPFLLSSILFAMPRHNIAAANRITSKKEGSTLNSKTTFLFSGIFLGLAIFTKIPIAVMIPFVAFLVYTNSNRKLKALALWFTPVILIPAIWPLYSISVGEFDEFLQDTLWQTQRHELQNEPLHIAMKTLFLIDPVLITLGFAGLLFVLALRKDPIFSFLWVAPFIAFLYFLGYVQFFYIVPIIPVFCISAAILINDLPSLISRHYSIKARSRVTNRILPYLIITTITTFGLLSTTILITTDINSPFFESYAFIDEKLSLVEDINGNGNNNYNNNNNNNNNDKTGDNTNIVIGPHWSRAYYWIPHYVFDRNLTFKAHYDSSFFSDDIELLTTQREKSRGIMVLDDGVIQRNILAGYTLAERSDQSDNNQTAKHIEGLEVFYNVTKPLKLFQPAVHHYNNSSYPYTSMNQNKEINTFEVRTNNFE
jgi:hypothetical protein